MPNTELFMMTKEDMTKSLKSMELERLLAELDDTIQFDILNMSNEKWITCKEKKVYLAIIRELRERFTNL